jgi:hypothetical protein
VGSVPTPGCADDVAVAGNYAYVLDGYLSSEESGIQVVDVSDPAHPTIVSSLLMEPTHRMAVAGPYAYVAADYNGLQIVDLSDPLDLHVVGGVQTAAPVRDVAVAGHYAYAADEHGLSVIDVTDPADPRVVGTATMPDGGTVGVADSVAFAGERAYLTTGYSGFLEVDVSDPTAPVARRRTRVNVVYTGLPPALMVSGETLYLASAGMQALEIGAESHPRLLGGSWTGFAKGVAVSGAHVYVTGTGLRIVPAQCVDASE